MHSVAVRLVVSFLVIAAVGIGAVAYLGQQATAEDFRTYVEYGRNAHLERAAQSLAQYYEKNNGWEGVEPLLDSLQRDSYERLVLTDSRGTVIADTAGTSVDRRIDSAGLESRRTIVSGNEDVGALYSSSPAGARAGIGAGQARGRGFGGVWFGGQSAATSPTSAVTSPEQEFLDTVGRSLWLAALIAGGLAIGLGLILAYTITRPLRALTAGVQRIARGDLGSRVAVKSRDEFGALAAAFNGMAESLERNERLRRSLMADVTHELRTPLSIIEGTADGILDGVLDPTPDNLMAIREEAQLLNRLVSDLRELALAEAGELHLDVAPVDVGDLVLRSARRWEQAAQEKGVDLSVRVEGQNLVAVVDAERLMQIVGNLMSNALRYTPSGGRIDVSAVTRDGEVIIAVADTGEGIRSEDLPYVFERLYRADKSRARRSGGTGLGLAIVKQLAQAHGGRVWVESEPGAGSTFYVALPVGANVRGPGVAGAARGGVRE